MATVSSFEGLQPPTRSELRQFAELFTPLFVASSDDAKRQAVAALSQCAAIPQAVALFIGCQPIAISAPFLISSPAIDDDTLITVARTQGVEHMRAIVSRDALSPRVIDVLVGLRHAAPKRQVETIEPAPTVDRAEVAEALASAAMPFVASEAGQVKAIAETASVKVATGEPVAVTVEAVAPVVAEAAPVVNKVVVVAQEAAPLVTEIVSEATDAASVVAATPVAVEVQTIAIETDAEVVVVETIAVHPVEPKQTTEVPPAAAKKQSVQSTHSPALATTAETPAAGGAREEEVRDTLRGLARHLGRDDNDRLGLRTLSTLQSALLVRFARSREAVAFATALADTLSASRWLAERIMLDTSGQQMATTLTSIGMDFSDAVFVLEKLYPHLAEAQHSVTRAWMVLDALDPEECRDRVEAWRRADSYTYLPEQAPAAPHPVAQQTAHARAVHQPPARAMRLVGRSR
jgi:uncharacterized protein (DUF2336 family)